MFDGLREKLGSFTKDVEEAAEVEELDDEDAAEVEDETDEDADEIEDETDEVAELDEEAAEGTETDDGPPITPSDAGTEAEVVERADVDGVRAESKSDGDDTPEEPGLGEEPSSSAVESAPEAGQPAAETEPEGGASDTDVGQSEAEPTDDVEAEADLPKGDEKADESEEPDGVEGEIPEEPDEDTESEEAVDEPENGPGFTQRAKAAALGRVVIDEERLEEPLWELEMALLESDVEMGVAEEILDRVREELIGETRTMLSSTGSVVEEALADAIYEVISVGQFDFDERIEEAEKPVVIVFTGVNGVGKTTSIAKLSRYLEERGYSSVLANGDTYRAGANEQIREHAKRLDRKLIAHEQGSDPTAVIYDAVEYAKANGIDVVLGDTAGRLHTDRGLMDQLAKIDRVVGPDMTLFVDEAVAGQDAVSRAREFNEASAIDGAILSKADADSQGGAAISIAHVTGKPILFLGTGQGYDDLVRFDPEEMVDRLLEEEP